ncbi:MAG TPA: 30S ribosomal protein S12 methylthiotransferase RimO [Spirochaetia bacterium]|nr:30S ribosomal protein S12 methylthiotransferase RimO [Spirochaetia bacterium]
MFSKSRRSTREPSRGIRTTSRSFHIESLGCAKNQVDSELMIAALQKEGWSLSEGPETADVLIVNTCGFISPAKTESIETTLGLKARFPDKKVIMAGCLTERYGSELAGELSEIDAFLGNKDPAAIVELVETGKAAHRAPRVRVPTSRAPRSPAPALAQERRLERTHLLSFPGTAYVKVAEGCTNRCTYCAIPLIRGDLASRSRESLLEEIRGLLGRGVKELVMIAQDLGSFGLDRGHQELPRLLEEIASLPGHFWVRLLYIHPDRFPREILDIIAGDARFLPYFDLPFQHAAPGILRAMGRKGDPEANLSLLRDIRSPLPQAVIRSTFLVGFPGETDSDFRKLVDFQQEARFDWLGAFTYSREEGTPAFSMKGRVTKAVVQERLREIERRQVPITEQALDAQVGKGVDVLIEERVEGEEMSIGRAYLHAPDVDGLVVVQRSLPTGEWARTRITRRNGVDLEAEVEP